MSDLVKFRIGERTVLVTKDDAKKLYSDMHLFGNLFVTMAKDGGRYERVDPANIRIRTAAKR